MSLARQDALQLDRADPLAPLRERFMTAPDEPIYLDGNSLGRLPLATAERLSRLVVEEWGRGLIDSWEERWLRLPTDVGDLLAREVLGAGPGEVLVCDSTSVNLYKLASAALDARPGRRAVVLARSDFPTLRYVVEGVAERRGLEARRMDGHEVDGLTPADLAPVLDEHVALVALSHVDYRSAAVADLPGIAAAARAVGALALWDLSHSAGAIPVDLAGAGADLAVGCTYKHLAAGPGAPAFLYVRRELQERMETPIRGWFGQRDQFAMGPRYDPLPGVGRFAAGTPPVLGLAAVEEGARLVAKAGVGRLGDKARALGDLLLALSEERLAPLGVAPGSPRDGTRRGAHVSLRLPDARRVSKTLAERREVICDFREPDRLRLGLSPLTTRYVDVWDALERLRRLVAI